MNGAPLSVRNPARSASFAPSSPGPPITPGCVIVRRPSYPPLTRLSRRSPVFPATHPSYPPLTRHSRENGNPCVLDVGLPSDKPKVEHTRRSPARSLSPTPWERESIPPLTRLYREACRSRKLKHPVRRESSRRSPVSREACPRADPVIPAAHPSFPRSLSPTPIGERESIPPLTRLSRENGNPCVLDVGLPSDKPKVGQAQSAWENRNCRDN